MTAELLGWFGALCALAITLNFMIHGRWSHRLALRAHIKSISHASSTPAAPRRARGYSIIEVMVATSIVGVLSATAVPSFTPMIASQRVKTATFDLYAAVTYARSEAIKRNSVVTVTPHGGNFSQGYDLAVGGEVLRSQQGSSAVTIAAPSDIALAFDGSGRLTSPSRYLLEVSSPQVSNTSKRCVVISPSGRPSIRTDNDHDGNCING